MNQHLPKNDKYSNILTEGNLSLYIKNTPYKVLRTKNGHFRDINTGLDYGNIVYLYVQYYDEYGIKLETPIYEQDHYVVSEEN